MYGTFYELSKNNSNNIIIINNYKSVFDTQTLIPLITRSMINDEIIILYTLYVLYI